MHCYPDMSTSPGRSLLAMTVMHGISLAMTRPSPGMPRATTNTLRTPSCASTRLHTQHTCTRTHTHCRYVYPSLSRPCLQVPQPPSPPPSYVCTHLNSQNRPMQTHLRKTCMPSPYPDYGFYMCAPHRRPCAAHANLHLPTCPRPQGWADRGCRETGHTCASTTAASES